MMIETNLMPYPGLHKKGAWVLSYYNQENLLQEEDE